MNGSPRNSEGATGVSVNPSSILRSCRYRENIVSCADESISGAVGLRSIPEELLFDEVSEGPKEAFQHVEVVL